MLRNSLVGVLLKKKKKSSDDEKIILTPPLYQLPEITGWRILFRITI